MGLIPAVLLALACGGAPPEPAPVTPAPAEQPPPQVAEVAPTLAPVAPSVAAVVPGAAPLSADERAARERLVGVVRAYGLDPDNAWAIGHALLALGPDAALADGKAAIDDVFARYATVTEVGGVPIVGFPKERDGRPVEPHSELFLKKLIDLGARPDRPIVAQGRTLTLADVWRGALWRTWVDGDRLSVASWNDTPWALQAIAAWSPPGGAWTAQGGHAMTVDGFTHAVVGQVVASTAFLAEARAAGKPFQKRGQGIFGFTCGGAHLIQGAAYAVARGFGTPEDRAAMVEQARLAAWRFPIELAQTDAALEQVPQMGARIATQRLKFTGHHLETMTRFVALGLVPADDPEIAASIAAGRREVVASVHLLDRLGVLDHVGDLRGAQQQTFLDLVGDGAHAVHALDLAAGDASIPR